MASGRWHVVDGRLGRMKNSALLPYLLVVCLLGLACASVPVSSESVEVAAIDDHWSLHVVTGDPGGKDRVTRIWIATVGGVPVLRTGDSRWWANLERDPAIRIRLSGMDHLYRIESVTDFGERVRIDQAFLEKYGRWERMMFSQERGKTHTNYARLIARLPD